MQMGVNLLIKRELISDWITKGKKKTSVLQTRVKLTRK